MTLERLQRRVQGFLARFLTSEARLNAYMQRMIVRYQKNGDEVQITEQDCRDICTRCVRLGLVNDQRFAEIRVERWYRAGYAQSVIAQKLRAESINPELIKHALHEFIATHTDIVPDQMDRESALNYARKRRIGPFHPNDRDQWYKRDMGRLARRGFSHDVVQWVLAQPTKPDRMN